MRRSCLCVAVLGLLVACGAPDPDPFLGDSSSSSSKSQAPAGAAPGAFGRSDVESGAQDTSCELGSSRPCYPFASGKAGVGACKGGTQACARSGEFGTWGECEGAVGPTGDTCGDGVDNDCDGVVDNGCAAAPPDAGAPINAQIEFHHLADTASWTNCLKIQINGGPETDLGCNKGAPLLTAQVVANAPPFCNIVRLNLYSNGAFNKSTANPAAVADSFIIQRLGPANFRVQCNDNDDGDYNDLNLTMNAVGDVRFTIENSGLGCQ